MASALKLGVWVSGKEIGRASCREMAVQRASGKVLDTLLAALDEIDNAEGATLYIDTVHESLVAKEASNADNLRSNLRRIFSIALADTSVSAKAAKKITAILEQAGISNAAEGLRYVHETAAKLSARGIPQLATALGMFEVEKLEVASDAEAEGDTDEPTEVEAKDLFDLIEASAREWMKHGHTLADIYDAVYASGTVQEMLDPHTGDIAASNA